MKLDGIGFYTLTDERARSSSEHSRMMRGEIVLTDLRNFDCPYCRGPSCWSKGTLTLASVKTILELWAKDDLFAVRFSGGEPSLYPQIVPAIRYAKQLGIERIAISTNGSNTRKKYEAILDAGVDDVSVSLDACCVSTASTMSGGRAQLNTIIDNIKYMASRCYVTAGVVVTPTNGDEISAIVELAAGLGVHDIRLIPAAQCGDTLAAMNVGKAITTNPILRYRMLNALYGHRIRGLGDGDTTACPLVLDDMAVAGEYHFPCIIYMREGGEPIGKVGPSMRKERAEWCGRHRTDMDPICSKNCLDVCAAYNNRWMEMRK